jgi:hypothetical protein
MMKRCFLCLAICTNLLSSWAQDLNHEQTDYLLEPEHDKPLIQQQDFFVRNRPAELLAGNSTDQKDIRVNPHFDLSQYSDELIETSGIDVLASPHRYHRKIKRIDYARLMPSYSGPTGLIDAISAKGLPRGKFAVSMLQANAKISTRNLFNNIKSYETDDIFLLANHGLSPNVELNVKFLKTSRDVYTMSGNRYHSSEVKFPEFSYGLKLHQSWKDNEFAFGFINTSVESAARNLILDQDFENYKAMYFSVTSPITYRTESHVTIKRSSTDNKFVQKNSWWSVIGGADTKITKDTHLLGEIKFEDYNSDVNKFSFNGGIRHMFKDDLAAEVDLRRFNQKGFSEVALKLSGAF